MMLLDNEIVVMILLPTMIDDNDEYDNEIVFMFLTMAVPVRDFEFGHPC